MGIRFSEEGCVPNCQISRTLGQDNQDMLVRMGFAACPGLHQVPDEPGMRYCSIPGRALDALYEQHPGIPWPMLHDTVLGVINNLVAREDIPEPDAYSPEALQRWGRLMVKLDAAQYPDQHFNIQERQA